jgi:peptide/nickel transport system permease protein
VEPGTLVLRRVLPLRLRRRLVHLVFVLLAVTMFSAFLTSLMSGDVVDAMIPSASPELKEQVREDLRLDDPLHVRYGEWLAGFVTGDLGDYYAVSGHQPVLDRILQAAPVTLQLLLYAQLIAIATAVVAGTVSAYFAGRPVDRVVSATMIGFLAVPDVVIGLLLSYYVGVQLGWLPALGYRPMSEGLGEHLRYMVLPALSLALGRAAVYTRLLRSDMVTTLQEGYIEFASASGLSTRRVLLSHALRPSSLTLVTAVGLYIGVMVGTAVVVEIIFALPGLGQLMLEAIQRRQFVALQSIVALVAIAYVLFTFVIDVVTMRLDPRLRSAVGGGSDGR